jgi:hypothetical protein
VGSPVTVESFLAWKKNFDLEMQLAQGATLAMIQGEKRLTGLVHEYTFDH